MESRNPIRHAQSVNNSTLAYAIARPREKTTSSVDSGVDRSSKVGGGGGMDF